tara:strand:- start:407 stop:559 length:153 start_codon:yes stop_codon:yes gene_type:complete
MKHLFYLLLIAWVFVFVDHLAKQAAAHHELNRDEIIKRVENRGVINGSRN